MVKDVETLNILRERAKLRKDRRSLIGQHNSLVHVLHTYKCAFNEINRLLNDLNYSAKGKESRCPELRMLSQVVDTHNKRINALRKCYRGENASIFCRASEVTFSAK